MVRTEHCNNVRVCGRVRVCGNSHFVCPSQRMLAVEAGGSETIVNKERKERPSSFVFGFCLLLSRYRRFCLLSAVGCVEDAKKTEEKRGPPVRVWNMLGFSSCSQSKCVRACVCVCFLSRRFC
jgi:hypothetical protein